MRALPLTCLSIALSLSLGACQRAPAPAAAPADAGPVAAAPTDPAAAPVASDHAFKPAIDADDFVEHVKVLSSDAFEGRGPGTPGEDKTVAYIQQQFERIGLKPGNAGSWTQLVPMTETTADAGTAIHLDVAGKPTTLAFGTDMVVGTRTGKAEVDVTDSPLVFVGYGVNAPERNWNDYAGLDVKGKTVVMLVNDPGFHANDPKLFDGPAMTYYGRWTYKFEEAARQGATAAIIIHDDAGAAYGWDVVKNSWSGAQYDLRAADDPEPRVPLQGWVTGPAAEALFTGAGLDLAKLRAAAGKPGFKAVPINAKLSVDLKSTIAEKSSRNVIGILPGSKRPDEAIAYMGHWDHLGKHDGETGDTIYNGAVDNATGVSGILEIAEAFATQQPPPERSVVFLAVTLEESGLLGSKYYVAHPAIPLDKTVAVVNLDAMNVAGATHDATITGMGNSELEDLFKAQLATQGRTVHGESQPQAGYYFRSDHFNFAKAGVPALYPDGGDDMVDGGKAAGAAAAEDYTKVRYHKPADQYDAATWKPAGAVQDLQAVYLLGRDLAGSDTWPNWYAGNPFRAKRDAMRAAATPAPAAADAKAADGTKK